MKLPKFLCGLSLCLLPVITNAGTAELFDRTKDPMGTIKNGVAKDENGEVLFTAYGNRIYKGADTSAATLLFTLGPGDVMDKKGLSVYKDGEIVITVMFGQFYLGVPPSFQDFTYMMGYFTEEKEGNFKIKEKVVGLPLGQAHAEGLSNAEYVTLFCVYMQKFNLDDNTEARIKAYKAAQAEAASSESEQEETSGSSTPTYGTVVYFTIENKCNYAIEYCIIDGGLTSYKKSGEHGTESVSAAIGSRVCIKMNGSYSTTVCTVSQSTSGTTVILCQP